MNPKKSIADGSSHESKKCKAIKPQVRKCKTTTKKRFLWSNEDMQMAVCAILNGMSQRQAAKHYQVTRATLQKMLNGKTSFGVQRRKTFAES